MRQPLEARTLIDVGYGRRMVLSSARDGITARLLIPAVTPGGCSFETWREDRPWAVIDLGAPRPVGIIRVFNHEAAPDDAVPLSVSTSMDGQTWQPVATVQFPFGGRVSEASFEITFPDRHGCRFIRLEVDRESSLHLDYVEVAVRLLQLPYGRFLAMRVTPETIAAEYHHHESYGFAWTFTCALGAIYLARDYGVEVRKVDFSRTLIQFKGDPTDDPYLSLFEPAPERIAALPCPPHFVHYPDGHHGNYATFRLADHRCYIAAYFEPSIEVRLLAADWIGRYALSLDRMVVLVYRGTDKGIEVELAPVEHYIAVVRMLVRREPDLRVAVQTDQAEALEAALAAFPGAFHLPELPVTTGRNVIHSLPVQERFGITRPQLACRLLAMLYMYADARYIVSHTGNIGLWLALYRGRPEGFYQFDRCGQLRDPSGALMPLDL